MQLDFHYLDCHLLRPLVAFLCFIDTRHKAKLIVFNCSLVNLQLSFEIELDLFLIRFLVLVVGLFKQYTLRRPRPSTPYSGYNKHRQHESPSIEPSSARFLRHSASVARDGDVSGTAGIAGHPM